MSYEVLARRLRPTTFDDVVGQPHVTTTLRNALLSQRMPHAVLLCGPRGVGKTSIARILARSLNCDQGPTDKPCGSCRACLDIAGGTSMDVQEIDAASHTGVENVREIRESIRFSAAPGKHRIFIIDEVHMLSQAAFNALLKTLEEPPPRSLFIFATTDPQKMPATVLSRVQRFDLRRLPASELLESLKRIAVAENLEIPDKVLRALIREGEGSFRDVLTLLDRLISGLGPKIDEARATEILGWIDRSHVRGIVDAVLAREPAQSLIALEGALDQGADPMRLASDLLEELRDLLVARLVEDPAGLIDAPNEELIALRERAAPHDPETLQRVFRVLLARIQDLGFAPRPAHALEVAVVRLATLPSAESLTALIERLDALEGRSPGGPTGGASGSGSSTGGTGSRTRPASETRAASPRRAARSTATANTERVADVAASLVEPATDPTTPLAIPAPQAPVHAIAAPTIQPPVAPAVAPEPVAPSPSTAASSSPPTAASHAEPPAPDLHQAVIHSSASDAEELASLDDPFTDQPEPDLHCPEALEAELESAPLPGPSTAATSAPAARPQPTSTRIDPETQRALRIEAKNHPAVKRVIELLDAEIRDIRLPRSA